jgi:predicted flap endonuclease-1-like 5' DNA nuclease
VPLARVCLEAGGDGGCRVVSIDPYPPYRRPQRPDALPAPLGAVNLAAVLWHRPQDACRRLAEQGVTARLPDEPVWVPQSFDELTELCKQVPLARCGEEICLEVLNGETLRGICLGPEGRVIGFAPCGVAAPEPQPKPEPKPVDLDAGKDGPSRVTAGATQLAYKVHVVCVNPNPFPVTLHVVDPLPQPLVYAGDSSGITPEVTADQQVRWQLELAPESRLTEEWEVVVKFPRQRQARTVANFLGIKAVGPAGEALGATEVGPVTTVLPALQIVEPPVRDDLTVIRGIAEVRQKMLREAGIATFAQLAAAPTSLLTELFPTVSTEQLEVWREEAARRAAEGGQ